MKARRLIEATFSWARHPRLPRRSVRLRLTALYGGLFLACGAALSVATYLLVAHALPSSTLHRSAAKMQNPGVPISKEQLVAQQRSSDLHQLLVGSGIALALTTILAVALGWLLARRLLRPLRTMTDTTRHISDHNLHERLAITGPDDELKRLSDTIDALLARLEASFQAQRRFIANASHELRTPLTMMRTAVDVATGTPKPPTPGVTVLAGKIRLGLDRADRLVNSFLTLARAQHDGALPSATVSLDELAAAAVADHNAAINDMRLTVAQHYHPAIAHGSETLLAHLIDNLIDNAIRHNQPGGWLRISTDTGAGTAQVIVENSGPLLNQTRVRELAQPFQRMAPDRTTSDDTGVGLGLSIVAAIATTHHGALDLHARREGGLRVVVVLPLAGRPAALIAGAPA